MRRATVEYDFNVGFWVARFVDTNTEAYGATPQAAVDELKRQANKHDLWPTD